MKVKKWGEFQHFKDRKPIWIKLYRTLLDDLEWYELPPISAKCLVMLWLISSETDGYLPDIKTISFRLRLTMPETILVLQTLHHWIDGIDEATSNYATITAVYQDDIKMISSRYQDDIPEKETETEKRHKNTCAYSEDFEKFWQAYPKKVGKGSAWKSWQKEVEDACTVMDSLEWQTEQADWTKENGKYIPMPTTYLNQRRWEDEPADTYKNAFTIF